MTDHPARPPEAKLLRRARTRMGLSIREAALRAGRSMPAGARGRSGISEGRLRQIESGYQTVSAGVQIPTAAPAETLAYLARFFGITAGELAGEGRRPDAAEKLTAILEDAEAARPSITAVPDVRAPADGDADDVIEALVRGDDVLERIWRFPDDKEPDGLLAREKRLAMIRAVIADGEPRRNRETGLDDQDS